jgi:DNA-binding IclR family transcriptional regulator
MAGNSNEEGRSVTSKVIAIIMTFGAGTEHSLTEIARLSGLPISTTHRLTNELTTWGMLDRTEDGLYRVGLRLRAIASQALGVPPSFHERARRVLDDLALTMRCMVRLGVLDGLDVAYIEKSGDNRPCALKSGSDQLPPHATAMGKALLAFGPPDTVDRVIQRGLPAYTPLTITSPDRLRRALSVTRLTRVAVARRELDARSSGVAAPVFGPGGAVVAAVELGGVDITDLRPLHAPAVVAARSLTRELQAAAMRPSLLPSQRIPEHDLPYAGIPRVAAAS